MTKKKPLPDYNKWVGDLDYTWFSDLADVGSEALFARACMAPTRANLEKLLQDLRTCRGAYCAGLRANVRAILDGKLRHEYRYHFGGHATREVTSSYGKISATSCLFASIRQAARYNKFGRAFHEPPIKLPRKKEK